MTSPRKETQELGERRRQNREKGRRRAFFFFSSLEGGNLFRGPPIKGPIREPHSGTPIKGTHQGNLQGNPFRGKTICMGGGGIATRTRQLAITSSTCFGGWPPFFLNLSSKIDSYMGWIKGALNGQHGRPAHPPGNLPDFLGDLRKP